MAGRDAAYQLTCERPETPVDPGVRRSEIGRYLHGYRICSFFGKRGKRRDVFCPRVLYVNNIPERARLLSCFVRACRVENPIRVGGQSSLPHSSLYLYISHSGGHFAHIAGPQPVRSPVASSPRTFAAPLAICHTPFFCPPSLFTLCSPPTPTLPPPSTPLQPPPLLPPWLLLHAHR